MSLPLPYATIRMPLECIPFQYGNQRPFTQDITLKLIRKFEIEGCHNLDPEDTRIAELGLQYLNGQHRVAAAKQFLVDNWLVHIYHGLSDLDISNLKEPPISAYTEPQILRSIVRGETCPQKFQLSDSKQGVLKTVFQSPTLRSAFAKLAPYEGLWFDFSVGTLRHTGIVAAGSELLNYLVHIFNFWKRFDTDHVDYDTVKHLHLLCPQVQLDRSTIRHLFEDHIIFQRAPPSKRAEYCNNILSAEIPLIPTLSSFFSNLQYVYTSISNVQHPLANHVQVFGCIQQPWKVDERLAKDNIKVASS